MVNERVFGILPDVGCVISVVDTGGFKEVLERFRYHGALLLVYFISDCVYVLTPILKQKKDLC